MNHDATIALQNALRELANQADEDCPEQYRTEHFRAALAYAYELLEALESSNKGLYVTPVSVSGQTGHYVADCPLCGAPHFEIEDLLIQVPSPLT
jgi:hypothetical protein